MNATAYYACSGPNVLKHEEVPNPKAARKHVPIEFHTNIKSQRAFDSIVKVPEGIAQ